MSAIVLKGSLRLMVKVLLVQAFFLWIISFNAKAQDPPPVIVSGSVFNDIDNDEVIDAGETFTSLPAPLYVYLVRNTDGVVSASAVVAANGSYSLSAERNANYALVLSQDQYAVGTNARLNRVTNIPPLGWVHAGINRNGITSLIVNETNIENRNFGLIGECSLLAPGNIDSDGDGVPDRCDLDDDNDGIPDTEENGCLNAIVNPETYPAGFTELVPSDFGITFGFGVQTDLNLSADLSAKFGYPANSGKIIVTITNAHVHPTANSFYVRGDLAVTDWEIGGSIGAATSVEHGMEYFPNQRREIRLYSYQAEYGNRIPVSSGTWEEGVTNNVHYVKNNTANQYIGPGNGAIFIAATLKTDVKRFGLYTNDTGFDRWSTYFVRIATECDDDEDGIPSRLDKDSDNDGCADAVEGDGNFSYEDLNSEASLPGPVSGTGVPLAVGSGQGIGTSQNKDLQAAACYVSISGTVWHDKNGDAITGTGEDGINPGTLYTNLVDAYGEVVASVAVSGTGEFTFSNAPAAGTFSVILTNGLNSVGDELSLSEALPGNWVHTGTNVGGVASTTNKTGIIGSITTSGSDISGIDFGIEQRPVAVDDTGSGYVGEAVTVDALENDDDEDGTLVASSVSMLVPSGVPGVLTEVDGDGDITEMTIPDEGKWTVNLTNGEITFTPQPGFTGNPTPIQYTVDDNAGVVSNPAIVTITYMQPPVVSISGTVWHDVNGDAVTNVSEVGVNPGTLYANLVDASGEVVASVAVSVTGEFTFSNAPASGTFSVILTNGLNSVGDELSLSEALPGNWVHTGTNVDGVASTTNKTGIIGSITTSGSDISGIDFGVQQRPDSDDKEKVLASQPSVDAILLLNGSDAPLMTGSDDEDGDYIGDRDEDLSLGVVITSLPTNGILQYYRAGSFVEVTVSDVTNGTLFPDPSLFSIKLTAGNYKTTTFQYAYVDAAGVQDLTPASYTISWESPLPVRLISFNAKLEGSVTRLSWTSAEEVNSDYFEVQHSADAKNWNFLDLVAAQGESNEKYDYRYEHASSTGGVNYYRLKMVDKNGTFAMSDIRSTTLQNRPSVSVYPNPVSHSFFLKGIDLKIVKSVKVISLAGVTVWETAVVFEAGITVNWGDGLYLVRVEKIDGTSEVLKLLVKR